MADRPILFSAPMVRALLDGRKTQTRRVLKPQPHDADFTVGWFHPTIIDRHGDEQPGSRQFGLSAPDGFWSQKLPYRPGDRLWVRETWRTNYGLDYFSEDLGRCPRPSDLDPRTSAIEYLTDGERELGGKTRAAIHMPRWASRLTLTVTDVRVERLQAISEADAIAEGLGTGELYGMDPRGWYRDLWDNINGPGAWEVNPWVVAVSFTVGRHNIDEALPHA